MLTVENFLFVGFTEILVKDRGGKILSLGKKITRGMHYIFQWSSAFVPGSKLQLEENYAWKPQLARCSYGPSIDSFSRRLICSVKECTEVPKRRKERGPQALV